MNRLQIVGLLVLMIDLRPALAALAAGENGTQEVLVILRADISEKPSRVLIAVEDALTMNEQAAGEIIKTAIEATRADGRLVEEIVYAALKSAPGMAAAIVEGALSASPGSVEQINEAARRALGEKAAPLANKAAQSGEKGGEAASGQRTGKQSTGKASGAEDAEASGIEESFGLSGIGIGGIYLITPARGAIVFCDPHNPCRNDELSQACFRP